MNTTTDKNMPKMCIVYPGVLGRALELANRISDRVESIVLDIENEIAEEIKFLDLNKNESEALKLIAKGALRQQLKHKLPRYLRETEDEQEKEKQ